MKNYIYYSVGLRATPSVCMRVVQNKVGEIGLVCVGVCIQSLVRFPIRIIRKATMIAGISVFCNRVSNCWNLYTGVTLYPHNIVFYCVSFHFGFLLAENYRA